MAAFRASQTITLFFAPTMSDATLDRLLALLDEASNVAKTYAAQARAELAPLLARSAQITLVQAADMPGPGSDEKRIYYDLPIKRTKGDLIICRGQAFQARLSLAVLLAEADAAPEQYDTKKACRYVTCVGPEICAFFSRRHPDATKTHVRLDFVKRNDKRYYTVPDAEAGDISCSYVGRCAQGFFREGVWPCREKLAKTRQMFAELRLERSYTDAYEAQWAEFEPKKKKARTDSLRL